MKRKRDPQLPINVYRRSARYYGYASVNGVKCCTPTFATVDEATKAIAAIIRHRRPPRHVSVSYSHSTSAWRVRIGPDRKTMGNYPTWDDAWAALKRA